MTPAASKATFIDIIDACDNFNPRKSIEKLTPWMLGSSIIGLLRPCIVDQLRLDDKQQVRAGKDAIWDISDTAVRFRLHLVTPSQRSIAMRELCTRWRDTGLWSDVIGPKKWRGELYPIYHDPFGPHLLVQDGTQELEAGVPDEDSAGEACPNYAFSVERSACALFGFVTYGVHMSVFEEDEHGHVKMWVPRRARTKQTWPGMLDNTVAGGIPAGMGITECIVKESMEEASLSETLVRQHARAAGCVSYYFRAPKGWLQPEIQYIYDLRIPSGLSEQEKAAFKPRPLDGEVESFEMLPIGQIIAHMHNSEFKPNCALVIVDFLVRHGYVSPENEPHYVDIVTRLHGRFDFTSWNAL